MDQGEQINAFMDDLDQILQRYTLEFDLSYAAVVGCLTMKADEIMQERYQTIIEMHIDIDDDDEEEEDWKNG